MAKLNWKKALNLEQKVAQIIFQQEQNGVKFDLEKAIRHVASLIQKQQDLYNEIRPYLKIEIEAPYTVPISAPFLKKGGYSAHAIKWMGKEINQVGGPFTRILFSEPDIGSRQKLIKQLLAHGWQPESFTDKGQPQLTIKGVPVESLNDIEAPIGKAIARWYTLGHRRSQIQGWISSIRPDGRLTAGADSCGTNTARMKHRCVVNCPKADPNIIFGYEMRDLFIVEDDSWLVGHDAAGLEARIMAHYTLPYDNGAFAELILNGDIHSVNTHIFFPRETEGLSRGNATFDHYRSLSKNGFYALVYGAQPKKLAETLKIPMKEAKKRFDDFWKVNYALGKLRDKVMTMADSRGWIPGLDGRKIYIRSSHSALNALFQSAGSIVMKNSMVILDHWVKKAGLSAIKVLDMHDEAQSEVKDEEVLVIEGNSEEEVRSKMISDGIWMEPKRLHSGRWRAGYSQYGELAVKSIRKAGEILDLRCKLDAEYQIGKSWAETH